MLKPGDVFQPKAFPKLTYIGRSVDEDSTYEEELQEALDDTGTLVVITGASKSGKTVLCHKVVERERYISLSGSQIQSQGDFRRNGRSRNRGRTASMQRPLARAKSRR